VAPEASPSAPRGAPASAWWTGDRVGGLILIAVGALVALETMALPLGTLSRPGAGYAPLICAIVLAALGLLVALRRGGEPVVNLRWGEARHAALILGAASFAALALERIGFRLTILALLVFLLGVVERRSPLAVAAVAAGVAFGGYYLFWNVLRVPLPIGPFGI
jgi:putative tricarboxylic transport membrane protein